MPDICLYFQAHQPHRLRRVSPLDIGRGQKPFDTYLNSQILHRVADLCYLPMNTLLKKLILAYPSQFSVAFSLSGCLLDQLGDWRPEVIASFQELAATGRVEFLGETYEHSLSYVFDRDEFDRQLNAHREVIHRLFGQQTKVFRHTELIYTNSLADHIAQKGFRGILTEGADRLLEENSPNRLYSSKGLNPIPLMLRDYRRSDDIAFRYNDPEWEYSPLDPNVFQGWIHESEGDLVNIFMDYETFGEHQSDHSDLFTFFSQWIEQAVVSNQFLLPSEVLEKHIPSDSLDVPDYVSWADTSRSLQAWLGNELQQDALRKVISLKQSLCRQHPEIWRRLLQSDHFYYMATGEGPDAEVHEYFSPYKSPYDAYLVYMNVLSNLESSL
ncbi:MAG: glycoside hydrolase family 57 protein [Bacteroidota bacterium]